MVTRSRLKRSGKGAKKRNRLKRYGKDDIPEREKIIHPYLSTYGNDQSQKAKESWFGGKRDFKNMPVNAVEKLMNKGFLDPDGNQNGSWTAKEMLGFMKDMKKKGFDVRAHGYEISADRDDTRITIEGLMTADGKPIKDFEFIEEWMKFNEGADEMDLTRSWWD